MKCKAALLLLLSTNAMADMQAVATVKPHDGAGIKDQVITLVADHHVKVTNNTNKTQSAKICYVICAQNHDCKEEDICQRVNITPGSYFEREYQSQWRVVFRRSGHFWMSASTKVEGLTYQSGTSGININ